MWIFSFLWLTHPRLPYPKNLLVHYDTIQIETFFSTHARMIRHGPYSGIHCRLASLMEGIDPPENMLRCFANNYDIEGFWKGWHGSYNRWLVRYMYIPLGGHARRALAIWPIFLFVAIWHDIEPRLLSWAWLMCLAFLPELLIKQWILRPQFDAFRETLQYRLICGIAAAINIFCLMIANMIGFVVGPDGAIEFVRDLASAPSYVVLAFFAFYCAAQLMFSWRT